MYPEIPLISKLLIVSDLQTLRSGFFGFSRNDVLRHFPDVCSTFPKLQPDFHSA